MMIKFVVAILLCFLSPQVSAQITADAKCLAGYEWMYSSIQQSPCEVAAELGSVCVGGQFNLPPLTPGNVYLGPTATTANSCRCSSVYYSLLSACAFCQGAEYLGWSAYTTNCSTIYVAVYNQPIPEGVRVPAYAYQNVSIYDNFDVTLAQDTTGVESSGLPSSTVVSTSAPSSSAASSTVSDEDPSTVR